MKANAALGALTIGLTLAAAPGPAQAPPAQAPPTPEQAVPVFGVESSVVLLDVVVRDKRGRLIRDLKASDFEVYEDGQKQAVGAFRVVDNGVDLLAPSGGNAAVGTARATVATPPPGAAPDASAAPAPAAGGSAATGAGAEASAGSAANAPSGPNVIAFLFDRLSTEARDTAHKAALAYTTRGHVDGDLVGVFSLDLALHTLQPFTKDIDAVKAAFDRAGIHAQTPYANARDEERKFFDDAQRLEQALTGLGGNPAAQSQAASLAVEREFALMQGAVLQSFDRLERDQQGFSQTNGLLALVSGLKALPGRKTVIFFSEGLNVTASVLQQFRSVIATANRANVTVYAIDSAGLRIHSDTEEARAELVATAARRANQEGRGFMDSSDGSLTRGQERTEDMMRLSPHAGLGQLAEDTGGFLVADTNDTARGYQRIQEEMRFYYLLSYAPSDPSFDGRFRTISVKLARPGLQVFTRKGYLAVKPDTSVPVRTFEAPALAQFDRRPAPDDFPLGATALSFPETKRPGRVPVMVQLPGTVLGFAPDKTGKLYRADLSIVARLRDAQGREVDRLSRNYPLSVTQDKLEAAKRGDVLYFQETDLRPGRYTLEAVAWDAVTSKASVRTASVDVPAFKEGGLRLSSLVLLQRVEQLSAAERERDNPLHFGEAIVYPNLGQPYRKSLTPNLGFYFAAYGAPGDAAPRQAYVELLKGDAVAAKLPLPLPAADANGRVQHAAALPLSALAPGAYTLRLTVTSGGQSATRQAPFVVAE